MPETPRSSVRLLPFASLTVSELHDLLRLRSDVFVVEQRCIYADIDGRDPNALHLLVRDGGGELWACGRLLPPTSPAQAARIGRIAIARERRGRGHGRWLIRLLTACCRKRWPGHPVELSAQAHLQALYRDCGYATISEPYDDEGILHVDMRAGQNDENHEPEPPEACRPDR